jgi:hypothetical protein
MSLPVHPIVGSAPTTVNGVDRTARWAVALVCAASAGVHAALVPEHFEERPALGGAFLLSVVLLAAAAVRLVTGPGAVPWVGALLWVIAAGYVVSRTAGLPVLLPEPEPADLVGVLTTLAEVIAGLATLSLPRIGKEPR